MAESERLKLLPTLIAAKRNEIDNLIIDREYPHTLQSRIDSTRAQIVELTAKLESMLERQANLDGRLDCCKAQLIALQSEFNQLKQSDKIQKLHTLVESVNAIKKQLPPDMWDEFLKQQGLQVSADGKLTPISKGTGDGAIERND